MDNNTPFMAIISLPVERRQRDKHKYMPKSFVVYISYCNRRTIYIWTFFLSIKVIVFDRWKCKWDNNLNWKKDKTRIGGDSSE